jgi:hypothetical protein
MAILRSSNKEIQFFGKGQGRLLPSFVEFCSCQGNILNGEYGSTAWNINFMVWGSLSSDVPQVWNQNFQRDINLEKINSDQEKMF